MRHLDIRDLWLQKEVSEGLVSVFKTPGEENPADLVTKTLGIVDIGSRLYRMGIEMEVSKKSVGGGYCL